MFILKYGGPPAGGGHPGGRRAGGRAETPAGGGQGGGIRRMGILYSTYMLTLWGKGGYEGSPNVEAGKILYVSTRSAHSQVLAIIPVLATRIKLLYKTDTVIQYRYGTLRL